MNPLTRTEKRVLIVIALHSLALGSALLVAPLSAVRFCGWEVGGPVFFPSQVGIFLMVLASAYAAAVRYRPFAWLLVLSRAVAVPFLVVHYCLGTAPGVLLGAAALDALMGLLVVRILIRSGHRPPYHHRDGGP